MHKLKANTFSSVDGTRAELTRVLPCSYTQLGFIEPGQGWKGKTQWLRDDDDLSSKYAMHAGKRNRDILLWCLKDDDQPRKKRAATADPKEERPRDKKAKDSPHYKASISEVEETIDQLKKIHGSLYTVEQMNCWAHMYQTNQTNKHGSLKNPPDLPYFKATKAKQSSHVSSASLPSSSSTSTACISPSKRVSLRTECIKQLELWHSLLENGGITKDQYENLKCTILDDIKGNL